MKPLVIIPARGGSKGLPGKNIKVLAGKPLLHYTIEAARAIFSDDLIYVSTDSLQIRSYAEETGLQVPFLRPEYLATDTAGIDEVLLHSVEYAKRTRYEPDTIILLQPTSPFRTAQHIREALDLYSNDLEMVVSVKETKSNPYFVLFEETQEGFLKKSKEGEFIRRQDCPKVYEFNGAIYIINCQSLIKKRINTFTRIIKYVMNDQDSLDIDSIHDWKFAEFLTKDIETN